MSETAGAADPLPTRPPRRSAGSAADRTAARLAGHGRPRACWPIAVRLPVVPVVAPPRVRRRHLRRVGARHACTACCPTARCSPRRGRCTSRCLYVGDLLGLRTIDGPRVTPMLAGIAATIGAWAIARRLAGTTAGPDRGRARRDIGIDDLDDQPGHRRRPGGGPGRVRGVGRARVPRRSRDCGARWSPASLMGAAIAVKPLVLPGRDPGWLVAVVAAPARPSRGRGRRRRSRCGSRRRCRGGSAACGSSRSRTTAAPGRTTQRSRSSASSSRRLGSRDLLVVGALAARAGRDDRRVAAEPRRRREPKRRFAATTWR